ncbi:MAG TPA: tetratricopeptide repeat protein, partial [Planctomycetota bacterium]|nr:tetratricopeptide repeat protein [Planctomycetota bacterium]
MSRKRRPAPAGDLRRLPADRPGRALGPPLLLLALAFAAFWPALRAGFVWDDRVLVENPLYRDVAGLAAIWLDPAGNRWEEHYWPLTHTTLWVERALFGLQPLAFHLTNLLLHAASAILAWRILLRLQVPGALLAAALFAVHPLHVESVAWVIERKDVLSGALFLAACLAWLRHDERGGARSLALATVLQAGAMLAKSIAAALPLVLLVSVWWQRGRVTRRDLLGVAPLAAVTLVIGLFDLHLTGTNLAEPTGLLPWERAALAGRALSFYATQLLWPADLMLLHPRFEIRGSLPWSLAHLLGFLALWVLLWRARGKLGRGPVAGLTVFALVLAPTLGLVDFSFLRLSFVADRFAYLAILAPIAVLAGAFVRGVRSPTLRTATAVLVVGLLCLRSQAHAHNFRDDETLFRHAVERNPEAWAGWAYLAGLYCGQDRYAEALACADRAVELRPDEAEHLNLQGRALLGLGRTDEALARFEQALRVEPGQADALNNRGLALDAIGRPSEAIASWEAAIREGPQLAQARSNLGIGYARQGRDAEAEALFREAIRMRPDIADFHNNLGIVLARTNRPEEAVSAYRTALTLRETNPETHNNLGVVLDSLERRAEAQAHFRRSLQLSPGYDQARKN